MSARIRLLKSVSWADKEWPKPGGSRDQAGGGGRKGGQGKQKTGGDKGRGRSKGGKK